MAFLALVFYGAKVLFALNLLGPWTLSSVQLSKIIKEKKIVFKLQASLEFKNDPKKWKEHL